jgi:hypothetical protein
LKGLVKWIYFAIAAALGSALGSRIEEATMNVRVFLGERDVSHLSPIELAQIMSQASKLSSRTDVDLWGLASFAVAGSWITYLPEPLFSLLFLAAAWKVFSRW